MVQNEHPTAKKTTLIITVATFCIGILTNVFNTGVRVSRMEQSINYKSQQTEKEIERLTLEVDRLTETTGRHSTDISSLTTGLNNLTNTCNRIEQKIDKYIGG